MRRLTAGNKAFYQFELLSRNEVLHFTSTKAGWGGDGKCRFTGDTADIFEAYRLELAASLGLPAAGFVFPRQTHSDHVAVAESVTGQADIPDTDALVTNVRGVCVCVQTADCVPVLLFDPEQRAVAAIHAGWRGTVSKIVSKTVEVMRQRFQTKPENLIAGIGPSISGPNYEVSAEVVDRFQTAFAETGGLFQPSEKPGHAYLDLWQANRQLLLEAGVGAGQIEVMGACSYSGDRDFYSARRDGTATGRMVSGIMLR